ncbi:hypothetical protein BLN97_32295 [Bradyrhizobium elkanii]|nr:hypothetical protein BLN97_32295 [Bradyrhizobium elkanii]
MWDCTCLLGAPVNYAEHPTQSRFLVRMGRTGWMVYDRERKGPALLQNGDRAEKLTKERAEFMKQILQSQGDR